MLSHFAFELASASALGYIFAGRDGMIYAGAASLFYTVGRIYFRMGVLGKKYKGNSSGAIYTTLPMYLTLLSIAAVKDSYNSAREEEMIRIEDSQNLRIEDTNNIEAEQEVAEEEIDNVSARNNLGGK